MPSPRKLFGRHAHKSPPQGRVPLHRLLIVWFAFPILRTSLPGMVNFDGIRHFLEFLPGAALLAGFGAASLIQTLAKNRPARQLALGALVVLGLVINTASIAAAYRPYEYLYFNSLTGGFSGAYDRYEDHEACDYWGVSYPRGMQWISENAAPGAAVNVPVAEWLVQMQAPLWLRPDIQFIPNGEQHLMEQPNRENYILFITRSGFYTELAEKCVKPSLSHLRNHVGRHPPSANLPLGTLIRHADYPPSLGLPLALGWLYGRLTLYLLSRKDFHLDDETHPSPSTWLAGMAAISTLANFPSLFIKLALTAQLITLAGGLLILVWLWRTSRLKFSLPKWHPLGIVLGALVLLTVLEISTHTPGNPDTGLYHAQTIRWIETFPAVPGLGNLHSRLAYNSSWLTLNALFSFAFLGGQSYHPLPGLIVLVITCAQIPHHCLSLSKGLLSDSDLQGGFAPRMSKRAGRGAKRQAKSPVSSWQG